MVQGLIFDFDGVILDTETPYIEAWVDLHVEHGVRADRERAHAVVGHIDVPFDPWEAFPPEVDRGHLNAEQHRRKWERLLRQPILPGVRELIEGAKAAGLKVGVASNSSHAWVDDHLHRLGLFYLFDTVRCREDVRRGKPFPDVYQAVVRAWGLEPRACAAFEDSPPGSEAARAAGLLCVVVPNACTASFAFPHAHQVVPTLAGMTLEKLALLAARAA
ncbi:HAD family hydrolase [Nibricoccus sp. IMCC34717]|uniref:HAD family hydrolase n=1 Tax=Nibricoccus sp. IMCC34717 TaxID=3034021 RepID=UPI00384D69FD